MRVKDIATIAQAHRYAVYACTKHGGYFFADDLAGDARLKLLELIAGGLEEVEAVKMTNSIVASLFRRYSRHYSRNLSFSDMKYLPL
jgi:hypothetical protein